MKEILKGLFDEHKYDKDKMCMVRVRTYHIYEKEDGTIWIPDSFPVKYLSTLRQQVGKKPIVIGYPDGLI